ncbi:protein TBATA-like [Diadema setosum]|uniref:protein TBATA-like n=1 Tax=Diadema setosum TaxID=31175 RepID=UPI003B3B2162
MSIPVFRPSKGDTLVVRNTMGLVTDNNTRTAKLPMTQKDFAGRRPHTQASARFGQLSQSSFFARHNPHSKRVRHIKGLLDYPICSVHDDGYIANSRLSLRRPTTMGARDDMDLLRRSWPQASTNGGRLPVHAINYHPKHINPSLGNHKLNFLDANTMYPRFPLSYKERADPTFGLIPVTDRWRDELRAITEQAGLGLPREIKEVQAEQPKRTSVYSAETGRLIPPPSRAMSRGVSRQKQHDHELMYHIAAEGSNESLVLEMLCQILQTDSISAVQAWLVSAGEREKNLVLDMIRSAISSEESYFQHQVAEVKVPPPRPSSNPPPNMNVTSGYAETDRPSPPPFLGRFHAVSNAAARLGTPLKNGETQEKTIFDDEGMSLRLNQTVILARLSDMSVFVFSFPMATDHPALRPVSHKPDVFRIEHNSPRPPTHNGQHPARLPPLSPKSEEKQAQQVDSWKPDEAVVGPE